MSGSKKKSWVYDTTNKESRKKVKRITNKIDRRETNLLLKEQLNSGFMHADDYDSYCNE